MSEKARSAIVGSAKVGAQMSGNLRRAASIGIGFEFRSHGPSTIVPPGPFGFKLGSKFFCLSLWGA